MGRTHIDLGISICRRGGGRGGRREDPLQGALSFSSLGVLEGGVVKPRLPKIKKMLNVHSKEGLCGGCLNESDSSLE